MLMGVQLVLYMQIYTKAINIYGVIKALHQNYPSLNTQVTININGVSLRDSTYSIRYDAYRILLLVRFQITSNLSQKEPHYFDFNLKSWSWLALRPVYTTIISMYVKFSSWYRR